MAIRMTLKQQTFIKEYIVDLNGTQAAIRAGYSEKTAYSIAEELLNKPEITAAIQELMDKRAEKTGITAERVLERLWAIATADPRELIEYWVCACRYCHGIDHQYQYTDLDEYLRQVAEIARAQEHTPETRLDIPSDAGGFGYSERLHPDPECPRCFGRGQGTPVPKDTRKLDPQTQALYAGVKITKDGIEYKMHDQSKALELIGKHLKLFAEKVEHSGPGGGPIRSELSVVPMQPDEAYRKALGKA